MSHIFISMEMEVESEAKPEQLEQEDITVIDDKNVSYIVVKKLGSGSQATVYLAQEGELSNAQLLNTKHQPSPELPMYAIKVYDPSYSEQSEVEINTLLKLPNEPNLVKMTKASKGHTKVFVPRNIPQNDLDTLASWRKGHDILNDRHMVCMEYCKHGDLFEFVRNNGPINDDSLLRYLFLQVCKGVHALHTKARLAHLDLKLENLLVGNDELLKICDFGMVMSTDDYIRKTAGTKFYCGPEVLNANGYSPYMGIPADMFSLGVVLFILAFGSPPFNVAQLSEANYRILVRTPDIFWRNHPNVKNSARGGDRLDKDLSGLISWMLRLEPSERPQSIEELLSHSFFTKDCNLVNALENQWSNEEELQA